MINFQNISLLLLAYIIGSIPSAVWIGKLMFGVDVRDFGSGNAGATNTFRVLGPKAGIPVFLIDTLKGFLAVKLVLITGKYLPNTQQYVNFELTLSIAALLGHIFPILAGFRGGKGVATLLGILAAVHPQAAAVCSLVFFTSLYATGYVSLSSMLSGFAFPVVIMFIYHENVPGMNIFAMFVCILVLMTHQKNIERLLRGEESKVNFLRKHKKN